MKELFARTELAGIQYNVVVTTRFGSTLSSDSGDNIFHSALLLNNGIDEINVHRGTTQRRKQLSTIKRRK